MIPQTIQTSKLPKASSPSIAVIRFRLVRSILFMVTLASYDHFRLISNHTPVQRIKANKPEVSSPPFPPVLRL